MRRDGWFGEGRCEETINCLKHILRNIQIHSTTCSFIFELRDVGGTLSRSFFSRTGIFSRGFLNITAGRNNEASMGWAGERTAPGFAC